jgi:DNA (cytosine-5)-methyltransferase 1
MKEECIFKLGELFCGPGGLALGASRARCEANDKINRIQHKWANDYDSDTCKTYIRNICPDEPSSVICKDVRKLDLSRLSKTDCFAYGFPCNDFSIVGEKKGFGGSFGPLYTYGVKVLNLFKPGFFLAENVGGLESANEGESFKQILKDLHGAGNGYELTVHLYNAADYGVPQSRRRIIIVGLDRDLHLKFKVPKPTTADSPITSRSALEDPPIPLGSPNNELTRQSEVVVERLKHIKPGENAWNAKLPAHLTLNVKKAKMSQIYRRLDPDTPSYTVTGSGGGGTHMYHWSEPRALTNRERARLQSFPDDFIFEGSKESVRKQIGMAVPPLLSEVIFTAILKTLAGIPYSGVGANMDDVLTKNGLTIQRKVTEWV